MRSPGTGKFFPDFLDGERGLDCQRRLAIRIERRRKGRDQFSILLLCNFVFICASRISIAGYPFFPRSHLFL